MGSATDDHLASSKPGVVDLKLSHEDPKRKFLMLPSCTHTRWSCRPSPSGGLVSVSQHMYFSLHPYLVSFGSSFTSSASLATRSSLANSSSLSTFLACSKYSSGRMSSSHCSSVVIHSGVTDWPPEPMQGHFSSANEGPGDPFAAKFGNQESGIQEMSFNDLTAKCSHLYRDAASRFMQGASPESTLYPRPNMAFAACAQSQKPCASGSATQRLHSSTFSRCACSAVSFALTEPRGIRALRLSITGMKSKSIFFSQAKGKSTTAESSLTDSPPGVWEWKFALKTQGLVLACSSPDSSSNETAEWSPRFNEAFRVFFASSVFTLASNILANS
mmetsp:Transcript_59755/g.131197  ORF Transcript_59755/g.131197 Transcript_59755/m.131197 type:complete len:331 (+) Transcript_59755:1068-2060(+)